jgi:hypothetical protein
MRVLRSDMIATRRWIVASKRETSKMFSKMIFSTLASAIIFSSAGADPASAASCSEWKAECVATAQGGTVFYFGMTPHNEKVSLCEKELRACIARCKAGKKIFVGPFTGKEYPITVCN